jgi:hypothetical protein
MAPGGGDKFRCLVSESSDTSSLMKVSGAGPDGNRIRKLGATFRERLAGMWLCSGSLTRLTFTTRSVVAFHMVTMYVAKCVLSQGESGVRSLASLRYSVL